MPTYEYRCRACGHRLERFQKMSDAPLRRCPRCRKMKLERLIGTGGGVVFRGPGFYATDYRTPPPGPGDGSKGGTKSDAKEGGSTGKRETGGGDAGKKDG